MRFLILYASVDGQTFKISQRLKRVMEGKDFTVNLLSADALDPLDNMEAELARYDKIIIGSSIRYGKHNRKVIDFVKGQKALLDSMPNAFFSVNLVARKQEKSLPDTNPYVVKFLKEASWQPKQIAVFAGKLDYPRYSFFDRLLIRGIMWMTDGPTDPRTVIEYTDWQRVEDFGLQLCEA